MKVFYCIIAIVLNLSIGLINAQCLVCDSKENYDCINPDGTSRAQACSQSSNLGCYSKIVDGITYRGCTGDLDQSVRESCTDDTVCRLCNGTNCNGGLFPSHRIFCHYCDPIGDQNCTNSVTEIASPCKIYARDDKCIVRKISEGRVKRECLSDYEDCGKEATCKDCDGHGCNSFEYNAAISLSIHNTIFFTGLAYFLSKLF